MEINKTHRLLKRQVKRFNLTRDQIRHLEGFLSAVEEAYHSFDKDLHHLENILEKSSQELFKVNQLLKKDIEIKSKEILQTKTQLERVVNNVRNVIFQTNLEGELKYLNSAWENLTALKVSESLNQDFRKILRQLSKDEQVCFPCMVKEGLERFQKVIPIENKRGEERWIDLSLQVTRDSNGNPDGTIGNIADVTDLKKSEISLIRAKEKLNHANRAKESFLSTMSHEIRTPLNGVIGLANILMMEEHLPSQVENLNTLLFSAEHLLGLINDLIDLNKIESGRIEFEQSEFSFDTMLQGIGKTFSYQAEEKGIRFLTKKDESIPSVLVGDSIRLLQVLTNLIGNAMKFTKEGRIVLDVEKESETDDSITLHFSIIDTGIGIRKAHLQKIFERFAQAESTTTREYGGTGLGLTICKSLLLQQNSDLSVESSYGEGSRFFFSLTFGKSERFEIKAPDFIDMQPSYSGMDDYHILLAEDNIVNVKVIERLFKKWNIKCTVAENGQDAVEAIKKQPFDLILMDIQMPVMDGYHATREIRKLDGERFQLVPIIALTASAEVTIQNEAKASGMNDFMTKPFNPVKLYNKLKEYYHLGKPA